MAEPLKLRRLAAALAIAAAPAVAGCAPSGGRTTQPLAGPTSQTARPKLSVHEQWLKRPALPSCGNVPLSSHAKHDGSGRLAATGPERECLRAALTSGRGGEVIVHYLTVEGDPITEYRRVTPAGATETYTDSTHDKFGSRDWVYAS